MSDLDTALRVAVDAHRGQKDRYGSPFILHPLRVMLSLESEAERIVGVLHDTVERTPRTYADLRREGFSEEVIAAVDRLTKREGEAYLDYIRRTAGEALAKRVKWADLQDHLNLLRGRGLNPADKERLARYRQAMHALLESGDPRQKDE